MWLTFRLEVEELERLGFEREALHHQAEHE